jgi:hypothetical protein
MLEQLGCRDDVRIVLRAHTSHHATDELDAFVWLEDAGLRHPVVLLQRETALIHSFCGSRHTLTLPPLYLHAYRRRKTEPRASLSSMSFFGVADSHDSVRTAFRSRPGQLLLDVFV